MIDDSDMVSLILSPPPGASTMSAFVCLFGCVSGGTAKFFFVEWTSVFAGAVSVGVSSSVVLLFASEL